MKSGNLLSDAQKQYFETVIREKFDVKDLNGKIKPVKIFNFLGYFYMVESEIYKSINLAEEFTCYLHNATHDMKTC